MTSFPPDTFLDYTKRFDPVYELFGVINLARSACLQLQLCVIVVRFLVVRYDEVCKPGYNFGSGGFSSGTGHFTQVVWKDSVKLGIGQGKATQNGMQCIYVVGRYDIAGNMQGEFQDQVMRGNFNKAYCNNV